MGFAIPKYARIASQAGQSIPHNFAPHRNSEIAGFDAISAVKIEVRLVAKGLQLGDFRLIKRSVHVVCVQDSQLHIPIVSWPRYNIFNMNKFGLVSLLAIALVGASFGQEKAQDKGPAKKTEAKVLHCAVQSKDTVDPVKATKDGMFADYKGRRYYFCCAGCPEAFKKDPAKYAKLAAKDSVPTPKPAKKS